MAVQPVNTVQTPNSQDNRSVSMVSWGTVGTPIANGDTGAPITIPQKNDISFQVDGTFGAGGSVSLEGSNDGTHYYVLKDKWGNAATLTAAGVIACNTTMRNYRPHCTAGDGTTALVVTAVFKTTLAQ